MIRASAFALRPDVITRSSEGGLTMNLIMWLMPYGGDRMVGARNGHVVTKTLRSAVRLATR